MKRIFNFMLVMLALTLTACAQTDNNKETKNMNKSLVAYFSATGTTKAVAEQLAKEAGATLYEIKPTQPYTDADLDWNDKQSRSSVEMQDKSSRPAIVKDLKGLEDFTTVYLGFPIWWYTCPTIINTFLDTYSLKGKTVVLFATSGGSTPDKALRQLKQQYPEVNFKGAARVQTPEDVKDYLEKYK